MWTSEDEALALADRDLLTLLGRGALRDEHLRYERGASVERWSAGLAKQIFEVTYQGFEAAGFLSTTVRLQERDDEGVSAQDGADEAPPEVRLADVALHPDPAAVPPPLTQVTTTPVTPEEAVTLEAKALGALVAALERRVGQEIGEGCRVDSVVVNRSPGGAQEPAPPLIARCAVWRAIPRERIRLRYNAASGTFLGWLHEGWLAPDATLAAAPAAPQDPEALVDALERSPLFPEECVLDEAQPSTSAPHILEVLWKRRYDDLEVENDFVFAQINLHSGRTAELSINVSELDHSLRLSPEAADEALWHGFQQHFTTATRCGEVRRMYLEIPGQAVKPLAWVGGGMTTRGPVQVAVGDRGAVLRLDSV